MPTNSYLVYLTILVAASGAALKYFVWDFFNMRLTLHNHFSTKIAKAQLSIHERMFLPPLAAITDLVIAKKREVRGASSLEILNELNIDARVREAGKAISEGIALDRIYERVVSFSFWVAISWLFTIISFIVLFVVYHHLAGATRDAWVLALVKISISLLLVGGAFWFVYLRARNKFIRILEENRF